MSESFKAIFRDATGGYAPFSWQVRFATGSDLPEVVRVPTGAGKTEGASLGWLWRRQFADPDVRAATPRRLVYCLPMRALVEQTIERIRSQYARLGVSVPVYQLMGGAVDRDWISRPEDDAVLVGTLDQLFSRALMRGYGVSRFRWPIEYGLLHSDCLWVLDEVQLFDEALATSAQLEGIRQKLPAGPAPTRTVWMSATVDPSWIATIDHPEPTRMIEIDAADRRGADLSKRLAAAKRLTRLDKLNAAAVAANHVPDTLTLVIVNTVRFARELASKVRKQKGLAGTQVLLLHSRFRGQDRKNALNELNSDLPLGGRVVVATQVVEAGVDISAKTLITESAPWGSMVQRFGRSNRRGTIVDARVLWAPVEKPLPYAEDEVRRAEATLDSLEGESVGPDALAEVDAPLSCPPRRHVLRHRDFMGLFDTAPDLSGLDLDISRFVRDLDDVAVTIAWRDLGESKPTDDSPSLARDELCPVALSELAEAMDRPASGNVYRFDHLDGRWQAIRKNEAHPGDRLLVDCSFGCYSAEGGFDPKGKGHVDSVPSTPAAADEALSQDVLTFGRGVWQSLAEHTDGVCHELDRLLAECPSLKPDEQAALREAARLHDWGKAHDTFQDALRADGDGIPARLAETLIAKKPGRARYGRLGFRHELASMLAYLGDPDTVPLVAYLIASHHGRVRLGARSAPSEGIGSATQSVLGCVDGDVLPEADLGSGRVQARSSVRLDPLQLGTDAGPTYTDMAVALVDEVGPIRLAYMEAILRTADQRRSARENEMADV